MNLIGQLFLLRLKQAARIIRAGGISLWALLPVILLLVAVSIKSLSDRNPVLLHCFNAFLLLFMNTGRSDLVFLRQFRTTGRMYLLLEYSVLVLVLDAYLLYRHPGRPELLLIELAVVIFAAFFQENRYRLKIRIPVARYLTGLLPASLYEWKSGLRQYFLLFFPFYVAGLAVLPFVPAAPFTLPFLSIFIMDFFKEQDPAEIVLSYGTVRHILSDKIRVNLAFCNLLFLPHYALFLAFHRDALAIGGLLLSVYVLNVTVVYAIVLKYTGFGRYRSQPVSVVKSIAFFIAAPVVPLSLYLCYRERIKAACTLRSYLK